MSDSLPFCVPSLQLGVSPPPPRPPAPPTDDGAPPEGPVAAPASPPAANVPFPLQATTAICDPRQPANHRIRARRRIPLARWTASEGTTIILIESLRAFTHYRE
jgi:hypothetical protein